MVADCGSAPQPLVHRFGHGAPILALHGWGGRGDHARTLSRFLQGRALIAPELGGPGIPGNGALEPLLERLSRLYRVEGCEAVLGWSMGGVLALCLAQRLGSQRAIAIAAPLRGGSTLPALVRGFPHPVAGPLLDRVRRSPRLLGLALRLSLGRPAPPEVAEGLRAALPDELREQVRWLRPGPALAALASLGSDALVIEVEGDPLGSVEPVLPPGVRLVRLPGTSHYPVLETPGHLAAVIQPFLRGGAS